MPRKKKQYVEILIDDPIVGRFKKGDKAEVLKHQQRKTEKNPFNFHVRLPREVKIGGRGLARNRYFNNGEVKLLK